MNLKKRRTQLKVFFILSIVFIVAVIALVVVAILLNGIPNVNQSTDLMEHLNQFGRGFLDIFNVMNWATPGHNLLLSIAVAVVTLCLIIFIIGYAVWTHRRKRYINILFTFVIVLFMALVLDYVISFNGGYKDGIEAINIYAIAITAVYFLALVFVIALIISSIRYDLVLAASQVSDEPTVTTVIQGEPRKVVKRYIINNYYPGKEPVTTETYQEPVTEDVTPVQEEEPVVVVVKEKKVRKEPVRDTKFKADPDTDPNAPKYERKTYEILLEDSEQDIKDMVEELRQEFMSYGMKSRISSLGDTFRLHTVTYGRIRIAGKGIKLHLALDPKDYVDSTIPFKDSGNQKLYEEIPFTFKVKSGLSFKRAKQLIQELAEKNGLEKRD